MSKTLKVIINDEKITHESFSEEAKSYLYRILLGDYKSACAHSSQEPNDIDHLRSQLLRGQIESISMIEAKIQDVHDLELFFEKARQYCFLGNFIEVEKITDFLIQNSQLSKLSIMTAHQMRALSYFEQNRYNESIEEVKRALNYETLFPYAEATLFVRQTLVRNYLMLGSTGLAFQELTDLQKRILSKKYNVNMRLQLMTYLRLVCFVKRHLKLDFINEALSGMWIAKKSGAQIYEALFILELALTQGNAFSDLAQKDIEILKSRYSLVEYYWNRLSLNKVTIETQLDINHYMCSPKKLILLDLKALVELENLIELQEFNLSSHLEALAQIISQGKVSKEAIHQRIWKSEYHPLENDSAIRKSLQRLKSTLGIEVNSIGGDVSVASGLISIGSFYPSARHYT